MLYTGRCRPFGMYDDHRTAMTGSLTERSAVPHQAGHCLIGQSLHSPTQQQQQQQAQPLASLASSAAFVRGSAPPRPYNPLPHRGVSAHPASAGSARTHIRTRMALHVAPPACAAGRLPSSSSLPRVGGRRFFRSLAARPFRKAASPAAPAPQLRTSAVCTKAILNSDGTPGTSDSPHVVCFGELLIDFVPTVNGVSLAEAPAFKKAPGGAPANVAVGIARLGGSSAFIGKVGDDEFGYMLADILKENNVNNQGLLFDPHARTALAFVTLRSDGEREFMFYRNPSADMLLEEKELDLDLIRKAKIFHHGSISLITEPCKTAHIAASKAAKDAGVLISYDPNLRLPLWSSAEDARDGILSIWETADVIKISEEEVSFLTNGEDPYDDSVVKKLIHPNLKLLLVTEGPDGCRYYSKEFSGRVGGLKVTAVDTTGAGDAFVAGILSHLAVDFSLLQDEGRLREALKFANVCGALTVTERGAIPALPTRQQVVDVLTNIVA